MAWVNKAHSVRTIGLAVRELDKSEDQIADLMVRVDPEHCLSWVYS